VAGQPVDIDSVLMRRVAHRDHRSFEMLHQRHHQRCLAVAHRVLGATDQSEDVVQAVFLDVWRHAQRFDPAKGSVAEWLAGVTHHKAVDMVRAQEKHRHRRAPQELLDALPCPHRRPDEEAVSAEAVRRLTTALARLSGPQQEVLRLGYFGGHSQSQIAAGLGLPLGTVKTRTRCGLRILRELLDTGPEGPTS